MLVVAALGVVAPDAQATTGAITTATATADWTQGHIAGSITWTDCAAASCPWTPIVTVQPSLPEYYCRGDESLDSDPNTRVVWSGGQQTTDTTVAFDVPEALILPGVFGQRACLSAIETVHHQDPLCVAQAPIFGMDPASCPVQAYTTTTQPIASALLAVPPPAPDPSPPIPDPPATLPPSTALTAPFAKRTATTALGKRYGAKWKKGSHRSLSCHRLAAQTYECPVSFRYKRQRFAGRVVVSGTQEHAATRVLVTGRKAP